MVRGIAARVQLINKSYDSFTVRDVKDSGAETELSKRARAIRSDGGWIYPHLTVQAYISDDGNRDELLSFAVARTEDVVSYALKWGVSERVSNAFFRVVYWDKFEKAGYKIYSKHY